MRLTIGTDASNNIVLVGRHISPFHAIISLKDGNIYIEPLETKFGVSVNGNMINKIQLLKKSDRVRFGSFLFHWKDYLVNKKVENNHLYLIDLVRLKGLIDWSTYKSILLLALGFFITLPIAVPAFLHFLANLRIGSRLSNNFPFPFMDVEYLTPRILIFIGAIAIYIFINLTAKFIKWKKTK